RYRCFLPDLAGLAGMHRAGPMPDESILASADWRFSAPLSCSGTHVAAENLKKHQPLRTRRYTKECGKLFWPSCVFVPLVVDAFALDTIFTTEAQRHRERQKIINSFDAGVRHLSRHET